MIRRTLLKLFAGTAAGGVGGFLMSVPKREEYHHLPRPQAIQEIENSLIKGTKHGMLSGFIAAVMVNINPESTPKSEQEPGPK